jgi:two-component system sensor histidine kinase ChvG
VRAILSPRADQRPGAPTAARPVYPAPSRLRWSRSLPLTARILAVNVIALGLMAGSLLYLDSYRKQLLTERFGQARAEVQITADALRETNPNERARLLLRIGESQHLRLRVFAKNGAVLADNFALGPPTFTFVDPSKDSWLQWGARVLDRITDFLLGTPPIEPYSERGDGTHWPEVVKAASQSNTIIVLRMAPDRTPVITAASPIGDHGRVLMTTRNATDVTQSVRDARQTLAIVIALALAVSIFLSLFLARTIVKPLRSLVRAAVRVRLGRDREVVVPRLPERGDEIGLLARAISDMTSALRQRIDSVESFAADVAHELKNPLASLRSALESLDRVENPALRHQLIAIARHDVRRIDRLVTEISDASRIDAELSRTEFEPVDMAQLAVALIGERQDRGVNGASPINVARHGHGSALVGGDPARLERVLHNLLDNAVSFSPEGAPIEVEVATGGERVALSVSDHGPGIPPEAREKVFERFHSLRPAGEDFASHSGLGLAIARTIVEAHYGSLTANDRGDGRPGARMIVELPVAEAVA